MAPTSAGAARLRVGVDLVDVAEVEHALAAFGPRYVDRVYTAGEALGATGTESYARRLAARFAAKEAVLKVLRPQGSIPPWTDIEVVTGPGGWPELALHDQAARLAESSGIDDIALSLTHEGRYAMAVAVAGSSGSTAAAPTTAARRDDSRHDAAGEG